MAAGAALPGAFAPIALWPIAMLAPAALFWACAEGSVRRVAIRGFGFGLASFGLGVSWIHESFQFSNVALPLAVLLTAGFVAFLSLYPALACLAYAYAARGGDRGGLVAAAGFTGAYVLVEWLRGWLLSGFTWMQLGYAQVDGPLWTLLPVGGVYGTGAALALAACALVASARRGGSALAVTLLLVGILGGAAATLEPDRWTQAIGDPVEVAVVQGNVAQDAKWLPEMREPTLERYLDLTARHLDADLVVWPETAIPGARDRMAGYLDRLAALAASSGTSVLVGLPEVDRDQARIYNAVELLGRSSGRYRKRHLVPFGEFLPLPALLGPIVRALDIPVSNFSPGAAEQPLLSLGRHRLAVFICYEIAFGAEVARSLPDANLLVTVSNDAWFGDSLGPRQHLQMARARAQETGRFLVRATNTGLSAVADPRGARVLELPAFMTADDRVEVRMRAGATPYVAHGDTPALAAAALALAALALRTWRRRGAR